MDQKFLKLVEISKPLKEDLEHIVNLDLQLLNGSWTIESYKEETNNNPFNHILVAKYKGELIGFIDYMVTFDSASICRIAVKKEYQRQGVGQSLVLNMIESFDADGEDPVTSITLEVNENNVNAIEFYKANGFKIITNKEHYYENGDDAYYMIRRLD